MNDFVYNIIFVFTSVIDLILSLVIFMMLARVILSLFPLSEGNAVEEFLYNMTEPFIIPVRMILDKFEFTRNCPIDISFTVSFILISIITDLLNML